MRMKIVAAVGFTFLLATGCADEDSGPDNTGSKPTPARTALPQKLAKPDIGPDLDPQTSPATDSPFAEQLAYELRVRTLEMARTEGETTAKCPRDLESKKDTETTCTTTFEGLKVEWDVTIGDKAAWSDKYVQYEATPSTGILTRDGVAGLLWGNYEGSIDYALCNNIPEAVLAPLDVESEYKCETVFKGEEPVGSASPVRATEAGPRVY